MKELITGLTLVLLACVFAALGWVTVMMVSPGSGTFTLREPMRVFTPKVKAGDAVVIELDYCKFDQYATETGALMASYGQIIVFPQFRTEFPQGCHRMKLLLQVPVYAPAGSYKLYLTRETRPHVFRTISDAYESEPFLVWREDTVATNRGDTRLDP